MSRLNPDEKKVLLYVARSTIDAVANNHPIPSFDYDYEIFNEKRGAFVSLHNNGELRGCIGFILGVKPLLATIVEMARAASTRDPRFQPITSNELDSLDIEISVLSPLIEISDKSEIRIGEHGLLIEKSFQSGLLLPQVATKYNWDVETFLQQTCLKANLPQNAWTSKDTVIKIFSADVFSETDFS